MLPVSNISLGRPIAFIFHDVGAHEVPRVRWRHSASEGSLIGTFYLIYFSKRLIENEPSLSSALFGHFFTPIPGV